MAEIIKECNKCENGKLYDTGEGKLECRICHYDEPYKLPAIEPETNKNEDEPKKDDGNNEPEPTKTQQQEPDLPESGSELAKPRRGRPSKND